MFGSGADELPSYLNESDVVSVQQSIFLRAQHAADDGIDVIELFGGAGHMTYMLCKHYGLRTGVNFEILAGIDLTKKSDVDFLMNYIDQQAKSCFDGSTLYWVLQMGKPQQAH